ncbi:TPM domain-containing protein [Pseudomonas tolaasii]
MGVRGLLFAAVLLCGQVLAADSNESVDALIAEQFSHLDGRIVDRAGLLDAASTVALKHTLDTHEQQTGEQIVVVTLDSLRGNPIEDFGYRLGRYWGVGEKGKNSGALLIVVPAEHRVRIEVGYGLEDRLTDAQGSVIINQVILPKFKQNQFAQGITAGVKAMVQVLGGQPVHAKAQSKKWVWLIFALAGVFVLVIGFVVIKYGKPTTPNDDDETPRPTDSGKRSDNAGGGGGSFGGGGTSGNW